jgi:biopolymer transport protein ExbD
MNKKIFTFLIAATMVTISASSQTIKDNIDKAHNDKDAKEKSAKADVLILKRTISDSTKIKVAQQKVISKTPETKMKYKKQKFKRKTKMSGK